MGVTKNWALLSAAVVATGLTVAGAAQATTLPPFTFYPGAVGLNGGTFTADNFQISDFSTISFATPSAATTAFTDNGTLAVSTFLFGSSGPVVTPGLNSTYGLYLNFAGVGTQTTTSPGNANGTFSSLNFTLNAFARNPGDTITYLSANATPLDNGVAVTPIELAAGALISGTGFASESGNSPAANAQTNFTLFPGAEGFFASPSPFYNLTFSQFGNTTSEVTPTTDANGNASGFVIAAGGGTINFNSSPTSVPEPRSGWPDPPQARLNLDASHAPRDGMPSRGFLLPG